MKEQEHADPTLAIRCAGQSDSPAVAVWSRVILIKSCAPVRAAHQSPSGGTLLRGVAAAE